jgi:hypothetical protein
MSAMKTNALPGRRCAICGKIGGSGATTALNLLGIETPKGEIGYAHGPCLIRQHKINDKIIERKR